MIDEFYLALAISQVIVLFVIAGPKPLQILIYLGLKKNPKWIAEHPEFTRHRLLDKISKIFFYLLAIGSSLAIVLFTIINNSPELYFKLMFYPLNIGGCFIMLSLAFLHYGVLRGIPVPEVVRASLEDRRLSAYVPLWTVYLAFTLIAFIYAAYGWGFMNDLIEMADFKRRMAGLTFSVIFFYGALQYFLRRKYSEMATMYPENGRKIEIWMGVGLMYFIVFIGLMNISIDFFNVQFFSRMMIISMVFISVQLFIYWVVKHPKSKEILRDYNEKYLS